MFHWAGFSDHFAAAIFDLSAGCRCIRGRQGDVPIGIAEVIALGVPVVGEFEYCVFVFCAIADKASVNAPWIVLAT